MLLPENIFKIICHTLSPPATSARNLMNPNQFLTHMTHPYSILHTPQMALKFENDHETKLPGQSVQLLTKAPVGSFVFLLGVDESAELLGEGNDIDIPRVLAGLKPFRSSKFIQGEAEVEFQGFSESNAIIMTNAFGLERDFNLVDRRWCNNDFKRDDSPPEGFRDDDEDESSPEIPELKKLTVPETWIFKDF